MPEKTDASGEDQVRLRPILGIRPGVYLSCLYGAVLLVVLFFVLLYPGLSMPGSVITISTEPRGAAVLVDGVYMDSAPCELFVPRGQHRVELKLPGFVSREFDRDVKGRIFASKIFPLREEIRETLETRDPVSAFMNEAAEYAAWSFTGEPSASYQIPLTLSEAAYRLGPAAGDPGVRAAMRDTVSRAAGFAVTRAALRDLVRAKTLLDNRGLSPSPLSLLGSAEDIIGFLAENAETARWLGETLHDREAALVKASAWYETESSGRNGGRFEQSGFGQSLTAYGNIAFREIVPARASGLGRFYIAEAPLSPEAWRLFLDDNPQWRRENLETLIRDGLADSQYLDSWNYVPGGTQAWVSWHAAQAWCDWYSGRLSQGEFEAALPSEAQWETAAGAGMGGAGEFWEWCEDHFSPFDFRQGTSRAFPAINSPERSLKGGSWTNPSNSVKPETRASLPPAFCSPFVSFRPVLRPKGSRP